MENFVLAKNLSQLRKGHTIICLLALEPFNGFPVPRSMTPAFICTLKAIPLGAFISFYVRLSFLRQCVMLVLGDFAANTIVWLYGCDADGKCKHDV